MPSNEWAGFAEAAARDYALHHLEEFQRTKPQQAQLQQRRALAELERSVNAQAQVVQNLSLKVAEAEDNYRRTAASRLSFFDFIYFSLGGATGANFGDISPNHTFIRVLYSVQILLSILLLAMALDRITKGRSEAA